MLLVVVVAAMVEVMTDYGVVGGKRKLFSGISLSVTTDDSTATGK